jgi:hypothetical protein
MRLRYGLHDISPGNLIRAPGPNPPHRDKVGKETVFLVVNHSSRGTVAHIFSPMLGLGTIEEHYASGHLDVFIGELVWTIYRDEVEILDGE